MAIKAIVFDYGKVISSDFNWQDFASEFLTVKMHQSLQELIGHLSEEWAIAVVGGSTSPFWQSLANLSDRPLKDIHAYFIEQAQPDPQMLNLAKRLKRNYQVGLLSNQISDWLDPIIAEHQLHKLFDPLITSYGVALAKPDQRIYEYLQRALEVEYRQILFIDDLERNLAAARKLGIKTILFESIEQLNRNLEEAAIKIP